MNRKQLSDKIEWEGGLEAALEYGIRTNDLDPDDTELRDIWSELEAVWQTFDKLSFKLEELLDQ